jgi:phospholipid-translocating ATPase
VLILTWIVPISLRVNLDISKMIFSQQINGDTHIPGCVARNSNIPEELG